MRMKVFAITAAISIASLCASADLCSADQADGRTSVDQVIDSLFAVREFKEVAISPDGTRVAWVESLHEKDGTPSPNSTIFIADLRSPSAPPRRISAGSGAPDHAEHDIAWSQDGRQLAFLSDAAREGQLDLCVVNASGGSARRLTRLTGFLAEPHWSPDGKTLAFLFTENAPRAAGPLQPMTKDVGVIEQRIYEQRITTVDLASDRVRQLSPADLYVYEYDWSPDGKSFVATAAHGPGDDNWYIAELYTITVESGETKSIYKPPLQIGVPRWSPDGKTVAFIGGLMSDEISIGGDIFTVPAIGGEVRNLTHEMKASASWLTWLSSSAEILFFELVDGSSGVAKVDLANGKITTLWTGPEIISASPGVRGVSASLTQDRKASAIVRESFEHPPEIWAGPIGAWKQITRANKDLSPSWGETRNIHWTSDGMTIQGWLIYPQNYDPARRYPLVVSVHGGPGAAAMPSWPKSLRFAFALPSQGYFVLRPNPRGSFGQGEAFTQGNVKDFGYGDLKDILAGVDEVVKTRPMDSNRIGITGWSYGGYISMWAVTQTNRFRAAVAGAGISNWQSYYGENDIDLWMIPFFGASVYDDPEVYAKSSPITFIKKAKTPTLILVGDSDGECPPPQSYEFWHALKTLGVETQLVIYPNEGHAIGQPEHRRDIIRRTVEWFNHYLQR